MLSNNFYVERDIRAFSATNAFNNWDNNIPVDFQKQYAPYAKELNDLDEDIDFMEDAVDILSKYIKEISQEALKKSPTKYRVDLNVEKNNGPIDMRTRHRAVDRGAC